MKEMGAAVPEDQQLILSSKSPGKAQQRLALGILLGLLVVAYLINGPLAGVQFGASTAFVAIYVTAMFVTELITAILLYAQFSMLRSRAILVIASGYLFTGLIVVSYALSFTGLLAPNGLIGGLQTSGWLYVLWHCGFPIFVIGYALLKEEDLAKPRWQGKVRSAILGSILLTAALAAAGTFVCIVWEDKLPPLMLDYAHFSPVWPYLCGAPIVALCISALVALGRRRTSVLDLWLMVVICLYLVDLPLSYYPNPMRFSTGWYTVRVIGLVSSSVVLTVLLYEITTLYTKLLGAVMGHRREREARLLTGDAVAASIAHEFRQPLTAMVTSADAGYRFLDRALPNLDKAREAFRRIAADGHRAGAIVESIRSNFKTDDRTRISLDVNELIQHALALERADLQKHRIMAQIEPSTELPKVRGNQVQLQQVLLNLISNAIYAMATGDEHRILCVKTESHGNHEVVVSVADTGPGIAPHDAEKIFNPLFTTKSDGMGMGLSICRAIVEAHHGRLWVTPNAPRGAIFQFSLHANNPVAAEA
jgi:signal transduction histidine kinase